jgi:hypothetical protein
LVTLLTVAENMRVDSIASQTNVDVLKMLSSKFIEMCDKIASAKSRLLIESQSRTLAFK